MATWLQAHMGASPIYVSLTEWNGTRSSAVAALPAGASAEDTLRLELLLVRGAGALSAILTRAAGTIVILGDVSRWERRCE